MASPQRLFTLSLGSQMVRLADFRFDKSGGLILSAFQNSELLADPAADATRVGQTTIAVQELVGGLKASGKVNWSIPAQSVFARFVKLPPVESAQVEQIVRFEAQQNVPYPIDEVVWDYQIVPSQESDKLEVVLVAIKEDLLEELNGAVEGAGLSTGTVDVAPMALYNAFRYNYGDVPGCTLLIDIGARTTNLIFIEGERIFTRSITIGGNAITAAIAKDFEEPFAAAEERKKQTGFVSLGGAYADPDDPDIARVSKVARNTMTRLHAEIARSISFYRSQQGGAAPAQVYLCGGAVSMPYTKEFFSEKLSLPIEFFNPLRNVAVGSGISADEAARNAHLLGELVGLALRSGPKVPMGLNLRPASVIAAQNAAAKIPYLAAASVCLLAALGGWFYYLNQAATVYTSEVADLKPKTQTLNEFKTKMDAVKAEIQAHQNSVQPILAAVEERQYWIRLIDDLNTRLPERMIWVSNFGIGLAKKKETSRSSRSRRGAAAAEAAAPAAAGGARLTVRGMLLGDSSQGRVEVVDRFAKALGESPFYNLANVNREDFNPIRDSGEANHWATEYLFELPLKQPITK